MRVEELIGLENANIIYESLNFTLLSSHVDASHGGLTPRADPISVRFHICLDPLFCGFVAPISSLSGAPILKLSIE